MVCVYHIHMMMVVWVVLMVWLVGAVFVWTSLLCLQVSNERFDFRPCNYCSVADLSDEVKEGSAFSQSGLSQLVVH